MNRKVCRPTRGQMRAIALYEMTFQDICKDADMDECEIEFPEKFFVTLVDFHQTLVNIQKANPAMGDFMRTWLKPICAHEEEFGLDFGLDLEDIFKKNIMKKDGVDGVHMDSVDVDSVKLKYADSADGATMEDDDISQHIHGLPVTDRQFFKRMWDDFELLCQYGLEIGPEDEEDEPFETQKVTDMLDIDEMLEDFIYHEENKLRPWTDWEFSDSMKLEFIKEFEEDERVEAATPEELELCRRFTDTLAEQGNTKALHLKGYACYGGNALYPCDWMVSRDCMQKLFELTDDPQYANTLGYIYYYGRCNNRVPEYEKAFQYFSVSAANGLLEGMYKLADMFHKGAGCLKSDHTAHNLYKLVYDDCLKQFISGDDVSFADAALRMGHVYAQGIGVAVDDEMAYHYYLQAVYAARLRLEKDSFFGNRTVVNKAEQALAAEREKLPEDYFKDYIEIDPLYLMDSMLKDGCRCTICKGKTRLVEVPEKDVAFTVAEEADVPAKPQAIPQADASAVKYLPAIELTLECIAPCGAVNSAASGASRTVSAAEAAGRGAKENEAEPILFTFPAIDYCRRSPRITVLAVGVKDLWLAGGNGQARFDSFHYNEDKDLIELFYDTDIVAWINCEEFRFEREQNE